MKIYRIFFSYLDYVDLVRELISSNDKIMNFINKIQEKNIERS